MKRIYLQKAKSQIARPNTIRDINKQIVLNYIRDRSPISRADIARETELQRSTVSSIVDDLQTIGLIEEIGSGDSTGGRKPVVYTLKTGNPIALGIDITPRETTVAVADLAGDILDKETFPTSSNGDFMIEQIVKSVAVFADKYAEFKLEVGISIPGVTDQSASRVRYVPYFGWHNWQIGEEITRITKLPVTIENDANAVALAELWFGREEIRKVRNFITVVVAEGVGTGIVFDGQIYHGYKGGAGEFGHMIIGGDAPVECSCGSRSCWEALSSEKAAIARYRQLSGGNGTGAVDINRLIDLAIRGEKQAVISLQETAKYLGIGISNLIIGLSPQTVIVSGRITKAWKFIADELESISERSIRKDLPTVKILPSTLGDSPTLTGSLSLVLAKKFASAS